MSKNQQGKKTLTKRRHTDLRTFFLPNANFGLKDGTYTCTHTCNVLCLQGKRDFYTRFVRGDPSLHNTCRWWTGREILMTIPCRLVAFLLLDAVRYICFGICKYVTNTNAVMICINTGLYFSVCFFGLYIICFNKKLCGHIFVKSIVFTTVR